MTTTEPEVRKATTRSAFTNTVQRGFLFPSSFRSGYEPPNPAWILGKFDTNEIVSVRNLSSHVLTDVIVKNS
jgi:hypothetical protein